MTDVLPAVEASPFRLEAAAPTAVLGPTSVMMENGASSGSGSSRSSGGETVAAGLREEEEREREKDRTDSLAKLEGRAPTTPRMVQTSPKPLSPRVAVRDAVPRARLHGSPRTSGRSSRASVLTLDSLLTTGESVYEDATEGNTDDGWEDDEPNLPHSLSNLTKSPILPDTPPSESELAAASSDVRKTPRAPSPRTPPQCSHPEFIDGQLISPSSSFEDQAILLQRRATLQAEASRRIAIRHSISPIPSSTPADTSSTVLSLRRFSALPRQPAAHPTDPHRASISGPTPTSTLATSPPRQWHPKPLVLTPARTIHTPLTSSAASPPRRRESLGLNSSPGGHSRTHSNVSNFSNWSGGSRPLSPRSGSPYMSLTLGRTGSLSGPSGSASRRRSTGYVASAGDLALPREGQHRKSLSVTGTGAGLGRISWMNGSAGPPLRRDRSASEDTGGSGLTGESATTRYASSTISAREDRGTPDSSASEWSDEKEGREEDKKREEQKKGEKGLHQGSPSMNDQEWEQEYFRRTNGASSVPLESVQEGDSGTGSDTPATTVQPRFSPRPLQQGDVEAVSLEQREQNAGVEGGSEEEARRLGLKSTSQAPVVAQVDEEDKASQLASLPPPVPFLPAVETPSSPPLPPKEPRISSPRQIHISPRQPHLGSPRQGGPSSPRQVSHAPISPTTPNRHRPSTRYDELWNGEPSFDSSASAASDSDVSIALATPPRNSAFEASPNGPTSPLNPAHTDEAKLDSPARSTGSLSDTTRSTTPRKGKPIVIKSVTARSSAANARRSHRLSQVEPPLLEGGAGAHTRLSTRLEGGLAHNRLSARLGENGAAQRLSTRLSRRLSITPSSPKQQTSPTATTTTTSPQATTKAISPTATPQGARSPVARQRSPPQEDTPQRGSVVASGLAIWPPPAETKTVTLAPPLAYHTDSEHSSSTSQGDVTDDEDVPPTATERAAERERTRVSNSTSPRSSGFSFPNTTRRRTPFEPRDPRAKRDDFETGDSFLEVLLNSEPPPSMNLNRRRYLEDDAKRWSEHSSGTVDTYRKGSAGSFASNTSGATLQGPFQTKPGNGGGITKKLFGGLKNKSPSGSSSEDRSKKPISIAPGGSSRRNGSNKPRPVVSAPLELQAASHAMLAGQRSLSSTSGSSQGSQGSQHYWGSPQSSPNQPHGSIALGAALASRYVAAGSANDDAAEELASTYGDSIADGGRPSMDSMYRPIPKAYALPPGLLSAGDAPPPPPHRPIRPSASPSPSYQSGRSYLTPSPAQSFTSVLNSPFQMRSRQGSKDSSAAGSFISSPGNGGAGSASPFYPRKGSAGSTTQTGTGFDLSATSPALSTREVLREQVVQR
ncbi:hypothetical protein JCM11251_001434 [Rhodosporidiobolus azoricus]